MKKTTFNKTMQLLCITAGLAVSSSAMAGAVIFNTGNAATATVALGVNELGHLNTTTGNVAVNAGATGVAYKMADGSFYDATSPGCLCEGWGVAANGVSGYANVAAGTSNLSLDSFSSTSSTATSAVHLTSMPGLSVTQEYKVSASSSLFEAVVTITNNTAATMTDVMYRRAMDWDIPFDEFNEYVTIRGTATTTELIRSSDNGFASSNPLAVGDVYDLAGCGLGDFVDCGTADHGAVFDFGFGDLAAGESKVFSIFYGAAANEASALAALGTVGAELYSLGQESGDPAGGTPATFIFAFSGVGGEILIPTPEPSILALMGIGLAGVAVRRRKRQA
jgi:type IV pilus assembly protein PilY1